jgi:hypothetical protein
MVSTEEKTQKMSAIDRTETPQENRATSSLSRESRNITISNAKRTDMGMMNVQKVGSSSDIK